MEDKMLEVLGDYFVKNKLIDKGWKFHEFVREWKQGTIVLDKVKLYSLQVQK